MQYKIRLAQRAYNVELQPFSRPATSVHTQNFFSRAIQIENFAAEVRKKRSLFLSYRWGASSDIVAQLLPTLPRAGYAVWWDRWSGPRRLNEETAPCPDLKQMLTKEIENASSALIVCGASYFKGKWSSYEYAEITRFGIPKIEFSDSELRTPTGPTKLLQCLEHNIETSLVP